MNAKKLRDSILQYAFQGKLLDSNGSSESSLKLVELIKKERDQLIKEKTIKRVKISPIKETDFLWNIPEHWVWERAANVLDVRDGTHDTPKYVTNGIPLVTSKNLKNGEINFESAKFISLEDHLAIEQRSKVDNDDILFAMIGTIGNPVLVKKGIEFSVKNVGIFKSYPVNKLNMRYVYYYLVYIENILKKNASGGVQAFISLTGLRDIMVPIAPLKEQNEIVLKIENLLEKVNTYEELFTQLESHNKGFPINLEKSILQYAMQGKLVEQNPIDEPAQQLIEKIQLEKERLIKEKFIKKEKSLPSITEEEIPFDIPSSWEWVRLKEISTFGNFETVKPELISDEEWVLDLEEIEKNTGNLIKVIFNSDKKVKSNKYRFKCGDVLYGKLRPYLNKVIIAPNEGYCTTEISPITLLGNIAPKYLQIALMSPYFLSYANSCSYGVKMPRLGTNQLAEALIPLPPLKEQVRIINKIDELLTVSKQLKIPLN